MEEDYFGALFDSHSTSRKISSAGVDGKFGMSIGATIGVPNDSSFCFMIQKLICLVLKILPLIFTLPVVLNLRLFLLISYQRYGISRMMRLQNVEAEYPVMLW